MRNATTGTTRFVLDDLRWKNRYEKWANAAAMQERILQVHHPMFRETGHDDIKLKDLIEDHVRYSGSFDGVHFTAWAEEAGFHKIDDLKAELLRSKLAREYLEMLAGQLADVIADGEIAEADTPINSSGA
jgi:hypothetical protein